MCNIINTSKRHLTLTFKPPVLSIIPFWEVWQLNSKVAISEVGCASVISDKWRQIWVLRGLPTNALIVKYIFSKFTSLFLMRILVLKLMHWWLSAKIILYPLKLIDLDSYRLRETSNYSRSLEFPLEPQTEIYNCSLWSNHSLSLYQSFCCVKWNPTFSR